MKSVKGTKTEQNLLKSFAGESQARGRYVYSVSYTHLTLPTNSLV